MTMRGAIKNTILFSILLFLIAGWSLFVYEVGPERLIEVIGEHNSYILIFLLATFIGASIVTTASFYTAAVTFILGGLDLYLVAILSGIGLLLGDTLFYYLARTGKKIMPPKFQAMFAKITNWLKTKPDWVIWIFIFIYAGLTPLPGDILSVGLGLMEYPYKKLYLPLLAGNIFLVWLIGSLALRGISPLFI